MAGGFDFETEAIDLPRGAFAQGHRRLLLWEGRVVLGLTQGPFRPYLFPVLSPAGHLVVAESPPDHPHHQGLWLAADHVCAHVPAADDTEVYSYNFYVNAVFQGRAPGRIVTTETSFAEDDAVFRITQTLEWRGPAEWGAPEGRRIAREARVTEVRPGEAFHRIDVTSTLAPVEWPLTFGPTRHAYFNARAADSMRCDRGGTLHHGSGLARIEGGFGGGGRAGLAMLVDDAPDWFTTDWGVLTAQPWRSAACRLELGDRLAQRARYIIHDGDGGGIDFVALAAA